MNERTPELVEPYFSLAGKRLFYSPHPSYLGDHPRIVTRDAARFELGLRPETTVFLCFGAIQPYKGIEELIASAGQLAQDRPDLDWVSLSRGMGVPASQATTAEEFTKQFSAALSTRGPYLIEAVL